MTETARLLTPDGAPRDRIVGFETEYGLTYVRPSDPMSAYGDDMSIEVIARVHERLVVPEQYQASGERIYVDIGYHPEYATAEDTIFLDAAYRLLAGHVRMSESYGQAAAILKQHRQAAGKTMGIFTLTANTTDQLGNSWASHENFGASRNLLPKDYISALAAHHVSRIVWSGAGTVNRTENGDAYSFELSEKAGHIWEIASDATTRKRPLVNLRDTALADREKYRRIHIICGESIFSPIANGLRLASGSIVLRACELGVNFDDLMPQNPILAIRQISADPSLKQKIQLENKAYVTGVQHQQAIAKRALGAIRRADYITEQEDQWGETWLNLLDALERDPYSCRDSIDWMLKKSLIERELAAKKTRGMSDADAAFGISLSYHRLLPQFGAGMKLLQKQKFAKSPSAEVLSDGLPLPETRAKVRGGIIGRTPPRLLSIISWEHVSVKTENFEHLSWILDDPYETDIHKVRRRTPPLFEEFI